MATKRYHYSGDINAEHGGYFYSTADAHWDYADVVRITPCSDAGGPENCYWIESLTVNLPTTTGGRRMVLDGIGLPLEQWEELTPHRRICAMVDACLSYGKYDQQNSTMVRIGAPDPFYSGREGEFNPTTILRGNTSIRAHALRVARQ